MPKKWLTPAELKKMCVCPSCPSYADCGEHGFCSPQTGKSKCINQEKGCICGACPVTSEMELGHGFYCTRGSEDEQKKAKR
jgi:hypothetical protein